MSNILFWSGVLIFLLSLVCSVQILASTYSMKPFSNLLLVVQNTSLVLGLYYFVLLFVCPISLMKMHLLREEYLFFVFPFCSTEDRVTNRFYSVIKIYYHCQGTFSPLLAFKHENLLGQITQTFFFLNDSVTRKHRIKHIELIKSYIIRIFYS